MRKAEDRLLYYDASTAGTAWLISRGYCDDVAFSSTPRFRDFGKGIAYLTSTFRQIGGVCRALRREVVFYETV